MGLRKKKTTICQTDSRVKGGMNKTAENIYFASYQIKSPTASKGLIVLILRDVLYLPSFLDDF